MTNFNPNPADPNRVTTSRDVVRDNQIMREQNIAMQEQNRAIRENDSAATGLMLGMLLFGLAALGFGLYFVNQQPTPAPTRTIIREKTTTVPTQPSPPNVNVTVPNPAPPNVNVVVPDSPSNTAPAPAPSTAPSVAPTVSPPSDTTQTVPPSNNTTQTAPANP